MEDRETTMMTATYSMPMASRPPPPAVRPQLPRRQSRFTEQMSDEHTAVATPVASIFEHETARSWHSAGGSRSRARDGGEAALSSCDVGAVAPREQRPIELIARGMNGCTHGAACVMLTAIMIDFLTQWEGHWFYYMSAQAVALLVFLGLDTLLDVLSLTRLYRAWPCWALRLRLANGVAYIVLFLIYIGHGSVFPAGFAYWAMAPGYAGPVVYMFLWLLGVWNLFHATLRRHRLINGLRERKEFAGTTYAMFGWRRACCRRRDAEDGEGDEAGAGTGVSVGSHPRSYVSRTTIATSPTISLREEEEEEEERRAARPGFGSKRGSYAATTRTVSSHSHSGDYSAKYDELNGDGVGDGDGYERKGGLSPPPPAKLFKM